VEDLSLIEKGIESQVFMRSRGKGEQEKNVKNIKNDSTINVYCQMK